MEWNKRKKYNPNGPGYPEAGYWYVLQSEAEERIEELQAEVARLKDGMIEIADALCVPFPDLATKAEIIEQVAHHLDSLATSEAESEIARKAAEAKLEKVLEQLEDWCGRDFGTRPLISEIIKEARDE